MAFGPSTTVERSLQIRFFMQNKAKYLDEQMNVTAFITRGYENKSRFLPPEKQSQTNPNKAKSCPPSVWRIKARMNVSIIITRDYENISNWAIYENEPKTNPIKANQSQFAGCSK